MRKMTWSSGASALVFMTWHSESPSQCTFLQSACVMFTLGGWYSPVKARTWNMLAWKCECRFSKMVRGFWTRAVFTCVLKKKCLLLHRGAAQQRPERVRLGRKCPPRSARRAQTARRMPAQSRRWARAAPMVLGSRGEREKRTQAHARAKLVLCARALRSPTVGCVRLLAEIACLHAACSCADMRAGRSLERGSVFRAVAGARHRRRGCAARLEPLGTRLAPSIMTVAHTACFSCVEALTTTSGSGACVFEWPRAACMLAYCRYPTTCGGGLTHVSAPSCLLPPPLLALGAVCPCTQLPAFDVGDLHLHYMGAFDGDTSNAGAQVLKSTLFMVFA
jgi:hypothetical protein